jgi:large subunit ribosomal protein L30
MLMAERKTKKEAATKNGAVSGLLAAVVVRGDIGIRHEVKDTLFRLRLRNKHACVVLADTPLNRGALVACKDRITYGAITAETKQLLEEKRGVKDAEGKLKLFYRLHPPRGGFERKGIKKTFAEGGALGDRGVHMDELIKRMV